MKVIFLDIDGVINSSDYQCSFGIRKMFKESRDDYGDLFDPRCVNYLDHIVNKTAAKIVMSSSWRHAGKAKMQQMWLDRKLPGELIDITPFWKTIDNGVIKEEFDCRGEEIQDWLNCNPVEQYVILDDDSDMLDDQLCNFVQTESMYGLNAHHCSDAITVLMRGTK